MPGYQFVIGNTSTRAMLANDPTRPSWVPVDPEMPANAVLDERSRALFRAANWNVAFTGIIRLTENPPKIYLRPLIAMRADNAEFGDALSEPDYAKAGTQQRNQKRPDQLHENAGLLMGGSATSNALFHGNLSPQGRDSKLHGREIGKPDSGHNNICQDIKVSSNDCVGFSVTKKVTASVITGNSRTCNSTKFHGTSSNLLPVKGELVSRANKGAPGKADMIGEGEMPTEWLQLIKTILERDLGPMIDLPPVEERVFPGKYLEAGDMPNPGSLAIQKPISIPKAPPPPPVRQ